MKVSSVRKLEEKYLQCDISTETENFYARAGEKWLLVHNSPAIFAGIDPSDGKFFVAKKGIFNKNPKVYKTDAEVDADTSGDLNAKLKVALNNLPSLNIKGVIQGDLLYTKDDIKTVDIDGEPHISFHPNTIAYVIPSKSKLAKEILSSKMGVVWHTTYEGDSFENMKASFGKDIASKLTSSKNVWSIDALYRDVSGTVNFTQKETNDITKILSNAGKLLQKLDNKTVNGIKAHDDLLMRIKVFINSKVRAGKRIGNTSKFVKALVNSIEDYYTKEMDKRKTEKGKSAQQKKMEETLSYFKRVDKKQIVLMFDMYNIIIDAKHMIINKLDRAKTIGTFLLTKDGYVVTGQEGFVAIDHNGKNAVKLVDRLQFSNANFSPEIVKGWQK